MDAFGISEEEAAELMEERKAGIVEGMLDMSRVSSGKRLQTTSVSTSTGDVYVLSYRPMPDYYAFIERQVIVEGEHYEPQGQAISAKHFSPKALRLAPGEKPRAPAPKFLPAPDFLLQAPEERIGRWIRARVVMVQSYLPKGSMWVELNIRCTDCGVLIRTTYPKSKESKYEGLKGETFAVIGKLRRRQKAEGEPIEQAEYAMYAYVLERRGFECSSNVKLEGDEPLPTSR